MGNKNKTTRARAAPKLGGWSGYFFKYALLILSGDLFGSIFGCFWAPAPVWIILGAKIGSTCVLVILFLRCLISIALFNAVRGLEDFSFRAKLPLLFGQFRASMLAHLLVLCWAHVGSLFVIQIGHLGGRFLSYFCVPF